MTNSVNRLKYKLKFFITILLILVSYTAYGYTPSEKIASISVLADASLALPLTEIARKYSRENYVTLSLSYEYSGDQAKHISDGEDADIFITPEAELIADLKIKGLIDIYSEKNIAQNHLVLAGPPHSILTLKLSEKPSLRQALGAIHPEPKLILLDPNKYTVGHMSVQQLEALGMLKEMEADTVYEPDEKSLAADFASGQKYFVYYSNLQDQQPEHKIIDVFSQPVIYHAAVVASEDMPSARKFLEALSMPDSQEIFKKYGLKAP